MTPTQQMIYLSKMVIENGYYSVKPIRDQEYWAGLYKFMYTTAIVVGKMGDEISVYDRWCYHSPKAAQDALDNWSGNGEPEGWHRHPMSGRRRDENGHETVYA